MSWYNHPLTLFVNMTVRHLISEWLLDTLYLIFMSYGNLELLASPLLVKWFIYVCRNFCQNFFGTDRVLFRYLWIILRPKEVGRQAWSNSDTYNLGDYCRWPLRLLHWPVIVYWHLLQWITTYMAVSSWRYNYSLKCWYRRIYFSTLSRMDILRQSRHDYSYVISSVIPFGTADGTMIDIFFNALWWGYGITFLNKNETVAFWHDWVYAWDTPCYVRVWLDSFVRG